MLPIKRIVEENCHVGELTATHTQETGKLKEL
jgi:hypothetical protein